jgi:hypothetical protein
VRHTHELIEREVAPACAFGLQAGLLQLLHVGFQPLLE